MKGREKKDEEGPEQGRGGTESVSILERTNFKPQGPGGPQAQLLKDHTPLGFEALDFTI